MSEESSVESVPPKNKSSLIKDIIWLIVAVIFLRGTIVEAFKIPSASMEPTLLIGDHILVNKLSYGFRLPFVTHALHNWGVPSHGDVVVFTLPEDSSTNIIKRVIGLPGDTVEVKGTQVFVNGKPIENDSHARWLGGGLKDFSLHTVPEGNVFLMGDNRDNSRDARFWPSPFLEISRIKGRAFVIYWNTNSLGRVITAIE